MAGLVEKLHKMWNPPDDEYEEYYDDEADQEEVCSGGSSYTESGGTWSYSFSDFAARSDSSGGNRVVNINAKAQLQVVLFKPISFGEDTRTIADELLKRHTVVLNLEKTEKEVSRRIVDFLSGVAYANNGKIKRIATNTFIITPYNVDLTGDDVLDELENNGLYF